MSSEIGTIRGSGLALTHFDNSNVAMQDLTLSTVNGHLLACPQTLSPAQYLTKALCQMVAFCQKI